MRQQQREAAPQTHGNRLEVDASRGRLLTGLYSHAAAWRDLASISVPCDLRLREASDARCRNHCAVSLGDRLDSLALLETSHNCRKTRTGGGCETGRCSFLLQELAWFLEPTVSCWGCHGAHRGPALVNLSRFIPLLPHYILKADRKLRYLSPTPSGGTF